MKHWSKEMVPLTLLEELACKLGLRKRSYYYERITSWRITGTKRVSGELY